MDRQHLSPRRAAVVCAALRGDFAAAEREGRAAAQLSLETGSVASMLICHTGLVLALDQTGQRSAAARVLERMLTLVADVRGGVLRYHAALWEAYLKLRSGDRAYREPLAEALALGRREGYLSNYAWWPPMMSRLAAAAMAEGIEPDYVRQLIAARGLPPDEDQPSDAWPWPLRIRALGRFEVVRDGAPLAFRGKAQKKPLELLKTLVALGGEGVEASRLAAILWPDAAGDAAKVSFDSTLYRLRKLLGVETALVLTEGKLALDPRRAKLVRTVLALGRRLQGEGRREDAIALYSRALELDNLAEDLYRNLMLCFRELGRPSEALQVYRRCRELLSVVLGLQPSPETEAVRRSLDAAPPA